MKSFDARQVHNMVAIMLDPHFKALCIVENLVGRGNVIQLAFEYDVKVVPFLMVCFDWLNPTAITLVVVVNFVGPKFELEKNMFGVGVSIEEPSRTLIIGELSLFKRFSIPSSVCRSTSLVVDA